MRHKKSVEQSLDAHSFTGILIRQTSKM